MRKPTARQRAPRPTEICLSHASKDHRFTIRLGTQLRVDGFRVWYSERHIVGAQQWHDEIGAALRRCDWFVIVLSPSAVRSKWVKHELLYALRSARYKVGSCRSTTGTVRWSAYRGLWMAFSRSTSGADLTLAIGSSCGCGRPGGPSEKYNDARQGS